MRRSRPVAHLTLGWMVLALLCAPLLHAGLVDKLKKKGSDTAKKEADKAVEGDKKAETEKPAPTPGDSAPAAGDSANSAPPGEPVKVATISTKFDYVPGDSVVLFDDFRQDELGEFPAHWSLVQGTFEVVEMEGEHWVRAMSPDGYLRIKRPRTPLPEFWTLEFDFMSQEPQGGALTVRTLGKDDQEVWQANFPHDRSLDFRAGEIFASTPLEGDTQVGGRHHFMFMARGTSIKAYVDRQRLANVPDFTGRGFVPDVIEFRLWDPHQPMFTNVRFAHGCRPPKDMLATGKLVTYGIRFETGSDVVLPESAPVLRQVASYLEANPAVKLRITGHTDNVGQPAANLDLSKRRSAAVARVLSGQFAIAADRFATDGRGDTLPLKPNATPEGRAMNRRVEFARL